VYVIHIGKFFLSWQVNYNQVVVKCQVLQECFLQKCNMQKFQIWNIQIQGLFKDFQGPGIFFFKIQGLSRISQGPYEPCE